MKDTDPLPQAQVVYRLLFEKLRKKLGASRRLYISPEGGLHRVPFAAVYDGREYLLGQYEFHYLTSGRDLLREATPISPNAPLILADPDFQAKLIPPGFSDGASAPSTTANPSNLYTQLKGQARLPGTRREAAELQALLGVTPLMDDKATEDAVRSAHAPQILHIATHGVFLEETTESREQASLNESFSAERTSKMVGVDFDTGMTAAAVFAKKNALRAGSFTMYRFQPPPLDFPLNRSGLLLAGVEFAYMMPDSLHDGLLTPDEVSNLDLWGTQLVVLAACGTGDGPVGLGQGVYGLRRAFFVAGAETLVASLWSVSDGSTSELMISYYRKLVTNKKRVEAMEEAMREVKRVYPHPYYWAPFVVIGQDGPLREISKDQTTP